MRTHGIRWEPVPLLCSLGAILLAALASLTPTCFADESAQWIWSPDHPRLGVPQTACHFRKAFQVPSVRQGTIEIAADDRYELFVNGRRVGSGASTSELTRHDVSRFLTRGRNLVAVRVHNTEGATAALAARIEVQDQARRTHQFATDDSWVTSLSPLPFWYTPLYNDARWEAAQILGPLGSTSPWDDVAPTVAVRGSDPRPANSRRLIQDEHSAPPVREQVADAPAELPPDSPFRAPPEFDVETLLDSEATGSLIAMTFNEFGHVIASRESGELLLIHDSTGDQRPDKIRIYTDLVTDCHGILCLNGYVFVTGEGPDGRGLYRLLDKDRDGSVDEVRTLLKFTAGASESGPHGLTLGSDGSIYVVLGNHTQVPEQAENGSPYRNYYEGALVRPRFEIPGQDDAGIQAPGGTVLRLDINGERVQVLAGGLRNTYDLAFNREGDLFTHDGDAEADLGTPWYQPGSLYHIAAGAEFGWRSGWARWPGYYPDRLPGVLDTGRGAPTGMAFYHHYIFPDEYHDAMFVADWANGEIAVVRLTPNGSSYAASRAVFVEGDSRSISDLEVAPDGSLYFVTGGRGTVGGLYRVKWKGTPPRAATDLGTGLDAVIRQPQMDSAWGRQKIAALKTAIGADWDRVVPGVAVSSANPWQYRLRALDLLQLYGPPPSAELLVKIAQDKNERVRGKAAELMGIHASAETEQALVQLLSDSDRRVRRRACEALLRAGQTPPLDALLPLLKSDDAVEAWTARRVLETCPVESWRGRLLTADDHRLLIQGGLALMIADPSQDHAKLVLDQVAAAMQMFVTDRDFVDLLRVVQVALLRGEVPPSDVEPLREQLAAEFPAGDASMNRELIRLLVFLEIPDMQERAVEYLHTASVADVEKLHLALHLNSLEGDWKPDQRMRALDYFESIKRRQAGVNYSVYVTQAAGEFIGAMSEEDIRLALTYGDRWPRAALALLYRAPEKLGADLLQTLELLDRKILDSIEPDVLRLKVGIAAVLARSGDDASMRHLRELWDLDPERRLAVAMGLAQWPNEENWHYLVRSLPVLDGGAAKEVLVNLRSIALAPEEPEFYRHVILRGLQLGDEGGEEAVALLEFWTGSKLTGAGDDVDVAGKLAAWQAWYAEKWPELPAAELPRYQARGIWNYQELVKYLTLGDGRFGSAEKGSELFERVHCAKCHRVGELGEDVAPDLTTLSRRAMKKEILESVLFPSHNLPKAYATHTVITTRGRAFSGHLVRQDDGERLLLVQRDDRVIALSQSEIEEILPEKASIMPEGLLDELTLQEVSDLFAYLSGIRAERLVETPAQPLLR